MTAALEVRSLHKGFPQGFWRRPHEVLHGVSFSLPEGQTCGFVGGNGQGKTTTIKCLLGFIHPEQGDVRFFGRRLDESVKAQLGYLPERPYFQEFLSAREFLRLHWNLAGGCGTKTFSELCDKTLRLVDLAGVADRPLRSFSKGMLQRVGLAQALLMEPKLLILDEPMSGLDPDGRLLVKDILREQKKKGVTIFFSSHLLQDMDELCEHLTVIDQGRVLYDGTLAGFRLEHADLEKAFRAFRRGENL